MKRIQGRAAALSLRRLARAGLNVLATLALTPFVLIGLLIGLIVVLIRVIIAAMQDGYGQAIGLLEKQDDAAAGQGDR